MLQVDMASAVRTVFGKGPMRQLRMNQMTPGNLYSGGKEALPLQFDAGQLFKNLLFIHGRNAVVTLQVEGDDKDKRHVLIQEIQKEPVTGSLVHVDFLEIELDQAQEFKVPINYVGTAKGVDLGGEMQIFKNELKLKGCPLDIPDEIEVDVTPLEQGGAGITFGDLPLSDKVEMLEKESVTCVTVY
ncbi:50S ribosomal protein L25 [Desulfogranum mediterraneum]|uniref:50S ribosomal protein L25 n=1 Tax=Desulfogranum mediterraneum TaxID=160661 RepID=UPI0004916806|nr:50S ribosomal protein L25 [Desulfogranum mediterraneum]